LCYLLDKNDNSNIKHVELRKHVPSLILPVASLIV